MSRTIDLHEREVAAGLDLAVLLLGFTKVEVLDIGTVELLLARPLQSLSPGLVAEPVADKVGITGVDQDGDLLEDLGNKAVERLHPVTLEEEVAVDVKVAAVIAIDLSTNGVANLLLVQVFADPAESAVAEVAAVLTLATDVIDVLTGALVRSNEGIVAVDGGRDTAPDATALITVVDQRLAAGKGVVHALALALAENGRVATLSAGHGTVVLILGVGISQAVADKDGLEVDVAVLVGENLRSENRDVVSGIRLAGNMEVLLGILGELVEEQGKEGIDVLASGNRVADGRAGV